MSASKGAVKAWLLRKRYSVIDLVPVAVVAALVVEALS